jgi:hypothetical protein
MKRRIATQVGTVKALSLGGERNPPLDHAYPLIAALANQAALFPCEVVMVSDHETAMRLFEPFAATIAILLISDLRGLPVLHSLPMRGYSLAGHLSNFS